MSVTVKHVDGKACFFEMIVETDRGVTIRLPLTGVELEELERRIERCFNEV